MHHRTLLLVLTTCAVAAGCRPDSPAARLARELRGRLPGTRGADRRRPHASTSRPRRPSCRWSRAASCASGPTTARCPGPSSASGWARRCASASRTGCRSRRRSTGTACACRTRWTASRTSPSRRSSRAARSSTSSRPRTRARSGSTRTSAPASRSSAASTACSSSRTPRRRPYARDVVWVLDDWLLDETRQIFERFNTPARPDARRALGQLRHRQRPHRHRAGRARRRAHPPAPAQRLERARLRARLRRARSPGSSPSTGSTCARRSRSAGSSWRPATALDLDVTLPTGPQSRSLPVVDRFYPDRPEPPRRHRRRRRRRPQPPRIVPVAGARARAGLVGGARRSRSTQAVPPQRAPGRRATASSGRSTARRSPATTTTASRC